MISEIWKCGDCGALHGDEEDAARCCAPLPRLGYMCNSCEEDYDEKSAALDCCADKVRCTKCARQYGAKTLNGVSVRIVGFCSVCTPVYSYAQQDAVETAFIAQTGRACNVMSGAVY